MKSFLPLVFMALVFMAMVLTACSRESPPTPDDAVPVIGSMDPENLDVPAESASAPIASPAPAAHPVPGEPPESELQRLEFLRYAEIEKMGGLPVTATATGRQLVLKPTLYSVRKEACTPTPQAPEGWYECSLTLRVSLAADGSDPSEQGERIGVKWDGARGEWVLQ